MVTITKYARKGGKTALVECVLDTEADLSELKELSGNWIAGSTAFVIKTGKVLMKNSKNEWGEI